MLTLSAVGCDVGPVATPSSAPLLRPTTATTQTTAVTAPIADDRCSAVVLQDSGDSAAAITFLQRSADILDVADEFLCVSVSENGSLLFRDRFAIEHEWFVDVPLVVLDLLPGEYRFEVGIEPEGRVCTADLVVRDEISRDVAFFPWFQCLFQIEETGWWVDVESGAEVPPEALEEYFGATHCGWNDMQILYLNLEEVRGFFVRNAPTDWVPDRLLAADFRRELGLGEHGSADLEPDDIPEEAILRFDPDVELPVDAVDLGLSRGNRRLFLSPAAGADYLYVASPYAVERWPQMRPVLMCE